VNTTEPTIPVVKRIPTCPESHRESIDEFLHYMRGRIEKALNDTRIAAMMTRSPQAVTSINYQRSQLSCINWLISINQTRRKAPPRGGN